jgi:uncharacterized protein YgbK (DUF1537 family)
MLSSVLRRGPIEMSGLQIVAIADDLTGALEVGAKFAEHGMTGWVTTNLCQPEWQFTRPSPISLTFDTESRHLSTGAAAESVRRLASLCQSQGVSSIYKKTDSTLRGNIGSELNALAQAYPQLPLFYVPAYPRMGRTVRNGHLYVKGIPVNETPFAADPLDPVREADIQRLISLECSAPVISIRVTDLRAEMKRAIYICDGEREGEISEAARFITSRAAGWLAAGPASLAEHIAEQIARRRVRPCYPEIRNCLVVNGSLNPVSQAQIRHVSRKGWRTAHDSEAPHALSESGWVLLKTGNGDVRPSAAITQELGGAVRRILCQSKVDALIVFGGDTATGILEALECSDVEAICELVPGVPLSRASLSGPPGPDSHASRSLYLITKAGGFAEPDVLCRIRKLLTERVGE